MLNKDFLFLHIFNVRPIVQLKSFKVRNVNHKDDKASNTQTSDIVLIMPKYCLIKCSFNYVRSR